jgi:hypothetical protein
VPFAPAAQAQNTVIGGAFVVEPPTLIAAGFEWYVDGDVNRDASVAVSYRGAGDVEWKDALPFFRLQNEKVETQAFTYVAPNMFAGSVFDLAPDTEYEFRFELRDPDGVSGEEVRVRSVHTRAEPMPAADGNMYHVYPRGYEGPTEEPAFKGLKEAYFTGSIGGDWFNAYPAPVAPGDVILVHAGLYKDDRYRYGHELFSGFAECCDTTWDGTYYLTENGTEERPIVIKAAGDGEVIFDRDGNHVLFNVMAADYTYFEGITFRDTAIAIEAGLKNIAGSKGLTVKRSRFEQVGVGIHTDFSGSSNYYIADNIMLGRHDPAILTGFATRGIWQDVPPEKARTLSQYAVKVYGSGHVIAFNTVRNFHDGIDHATYGLPDGYPDPLRDRMPVSIDIYNNDISNVHDDCIEADGAMHNIRVLRNKCVNSGAVALSLQTILGGPAYFVRNVHYHSPARGGIKLSFNPSGGVFFHNTFTSGIRGGAGSNLMFRNNLILKEMPADASLAINTFTGYSTSDYDGVMIDPDAPASIVWQQPEGETATDYQASQTAMEFRTLEAFARDTGQGAHSKAVDFGIFARLTPADPTEPSHVYDPDTIDFTLKPQSPAIDAGVRLPNVNDNFNGLAPDLGALEQGQPPPIYGPRP